MGEYIVPIVGEADHQETLKRAEVGQAVSLIPEPQNPVDENAIKVVIGDSDTIGYLQRDSWLHQIILVNEKPVFAQIKELRAGTEDRPWIGASLLVYTGFDVDGARAQHEKMSAEKSGCLGSFAIGLLGLAAFISPGFV